MGSDLAFVEYVKEQTRGAGDITFRKMFGEYALYCNEKVVALVCDNQLFVKPTVAGRAFLMKPIESSPYQGAKPHFLIDEKLDDANFMSELIRQTFNELPVPKPKKLKAKGVIKQSTANAKTFKAKGK